MKFGIQILVGVVVIVAAAYAAITYMPLDSNKPGAAEVSGIDAYGKTYTAYVPGENFEPKEDAGAMYELEVFVTFALPSDKPLFDGFFGTPKKVGGLSGISCSLTQVPVVFQEPYFYELHLGGEVLAFIQDESGVRVDIARSTQAGLTTGCLNGATWADMPHLLKSDAYRLTPTQYQDILTRG